MKFRNNNDFILLFEKRLSEYTGAPYVVLTDSCTNAIFLSLMYHKTYLNYDISKVIKLPKQTYVSVKQVVKHAGFNIKFKNIKWHSNYQIGKLPIYDFAVGLKKNIYLKGAFQCLSFHQKKSLAIGKGGAILLDNYKAYQILKRMSHDGRDSSISVKQDLPNIINGYHMNMTPDDAAKGVLLLNQLKTIKIGNYKDYPNIE